MSIIINNIIIIKYATFDRSSFQHFVKIYITKTDKSIHFSP